MPTTISARDVQQYYPTGSDESAIASAVKDGWVLQGHNLVHPSDINLEELDESDTDDLDFGMLTPPTRPGPCKAATAPEVDPVEARLAHEIESAPYRVRIRPLDEPLMGVEARHGKVKV